MTVPRSVLKMAANSSSLRPSQDERLRQVTTKRHSIFRSSALVGLSIAFGLTMGVLFGQSHILPLFTIANSEAAALILPIPEARKVVEHNWLAAQPRAERIAALPGLVAIVTAPSDQIVVSSEASDAELLDGDDTIIAADSDGSVSRSEIRAHLNSAPSPSTVFNGGVPEWRHNAVAAANSNGRPMIAMVIDDLGLARRNAWRTIDLPAPLTLAFMSYAPKVSELTEKARAFGHELLVHVPMEPKGSDDPGENPLLIELPKAELQRRLEWALSQFDGYVGINNHMGSAFTASIPGMAQVMQELKSRGLLFLDSKTSAQSVGTAVAAEMDVPYAARNVFIDNDFEDPAAIRKQLARLEATAKRNGYAVGIGHPHGTTIAELARWLPELEKRGFVLVPVSAIVKHRIEIASVSDPAG